MLNMIIAVGPRGEIGNSGRKNGLPWVNHADLTFFKQATTGPWDMYDEKSPSEFTVDHYRELFFGMHAKTHTELFNSCHSNVVIMGSRTFKMTSDFLKDGMYGTCTSARWRFFRKVSGPLENMCYPDDITTWIAGGKTIYESAMDLHNSGKIKIDNLYVSVINNVKGCDTFINMQRFKEYIGKHFTYNNVSRPNTSLSITRFKAKS